MDAYTTAKGVLGIDNRTRRGRVRSLAKISWQSAFTFLDTEARRKGAAILRTN